MPAQGRGLSTVQHRPLRRCFCLCPASKTEGVKMTQLADRTQSDDQVEGFPASRKGYVNGSRPDLRVPMREIELTPTSGRFGEEQNPPVRVYDTSGVYT